MARRKTSTRQKNPEITSRRGKRRGKRTYVSEHDIARAKKGTPFVMWSVEGSADTAVFIVNPLDVEAEDNVVTLFTFGAIGSTFLAVLNKSLEDGLEEAAAWLVDFAPGHIMQHSDPELQELYKEALEELVEAGEDPEDEEVQQQAQENATADLTYTESGYLTSYEWGVTEDVGNNVDPALAEQIVNKSLSLYRKQYGEDPPRSSYRRRRRNSGRRSNADVGTRAYYRRNLILPPEMIEPLYAWHGGQNSAVYSLASTGDHDYVSASMVDRAMSELIQERAHVKAKQDKRDLDNLIGDLDMVLGSPWEFSTKEAGVGDVDSGYDEYGMELDEVENPHPRRRR